MKYHNHMNLQIIVIFNKDSGNEDNLIKFISIINIVNI